MENGCNLGWSEAFLAALRQVILRRGEVVSTSEDHDVRLRFRRWELSTRPEGWGWMRMWGITEPEVRCGQCAECSPLTPATIRRTAANLRHGDIETSHMTEDRIMRAVLGMVADDHEDSRALATEALAMASEKRTRWFA